MQVGIAGAGAIAMGYASFLLSRGHGATLWSPSGQSTASFGEGTPLEVTGALEAEFRPSISSSAADLASNDVIILALPAYGHRMVLDSLIPHLQSRHTIIISGHLSFAALYLSKALSERGIEIPIGAWSTTLLTSKAQSPTHIRIGAIRAKVDMAALPASRANEVLALSNELFGDRFLIKDDILTIALSNLNPQSHMGIALCNLTRIERGDRSSFFGAQNSGNCGGSASYYRSLATLWSIEIGTEVNRSRPSTTSRAALSGSRVASASARFRSSLPDGPSLPELRFRKVCMYCWN